MPLLTAARPSTSTSSANTEGSALLCKLRERAVAGHSTDVAAFDHAGGGLHLSVAVHLRRHGGRRLTDRFPLAAGGCGGGCIGGIGGGLSGLIFGVMGGMYYLNKKKETKPTMSTTSV